MRLILVLLNHFRMRYIFLLSMLALHAFAGFSQKNDDQRLIIITTDGYRWQELFSGMDSAIANRKEYNHGDSLDIFQAYWDADPARRREKLMPFFWSELVAKGQLYGNRALGSQVDVANPYWFSYPGYSELLTGQVDTAVNSNDYKPNPNTNILEYFNNKPAYKNRVIAFGAWGAFDRILNEQRSGFPVINAFDEYKPLQSDPQMKLIADMLRDSYKPFGMGEAQDVFTHYQAYRYLVTKKPKVLYISYGETDEFAHHGDYKSYLDAAHQLDAWIRQIWNFVQSDPDYKGRTTLLITTDHGRGDAVKSEWTSHGQKIADCHSIWYALLGAHVKPMGEVRNSGQTYQKDLIHIVSRLMGESFKSEKK